MENSTSIFDAPGFYQGLTPLSEPWKVERVAVNSTERRLDIWATHQTRLTWACPECGYLGPCRDHALERFWRHLDCAGFEVYLHARIPRVACPTHGVRQTHIPWASQDSRFTRPFERCALDLLATCTVSGTAALLGLTWDEARGIQLRAARMVATPLLPAPHSRRRTVQAPAEIPKAR
jgi:transposase